MATEDQLQVEARERPRMAIVAGAAATLTLLATIVGLLPGSAPDNLPASLLFFHDHQAVIALGALCSVLSSIAIAFVLAFLYRAVRIRNESAPPQLRWLPWVGGFAAAIFFAVAQVVLSVKVGHFATHGTQTYDEAKKAADYGVLGILGPLAQLVLAGAIAFVALQAMRIGLLPRFLGYVGVISAVLFVLPLVRIPIVQVYWLGALAALFAGLAPKPIPPAWERGEAVPWPSGAELREQRVRAAEARRGGDDDAAEGGAEVMTGAARRKRKKRR
jgi:hypothetical protein